MNNFRDFLQVDTIKVGQMWTENVPRWDKSISVSIEIMDILKDGRVQVKSSEQEKVSIISMKYILKNYTN